MPYFMGNGLTVSEMQRRLFMHSQKQPFTDCKSDRFPIGKDQAFKRGIFPLK